MEKRKVYNVLLGLGIVGGIYLLASKVYRKYKSMTKKLQDGELYIQELLGTLEVITQDGSVIESYDIPENNMSFPLSIEEGCVDGIPGGCFDYANVQKLQTVLLYQVSTLAFDLTIDGKFGNNTESALKNYLNTISITELENNGYDVDLYIATPSDLNFLTESLYNSNILPQYESIIS
tara:strand:- start:315 stop:848 length:534 start_codon:yes stop_codon:yes gene_type:complete